jgi:hypothetical protein
VPHDRGARTHEQGPSFGFIKSQRRPQTKKKTDRGERAGGRTERKRKEKKNRQRECRESREERGEKEEEHRDREKTGDQNK